MIIRPAIASDASGILEIYTPIVERTAITFETKVPDLEEVERRIEQINSRHIWLVMVDNHSIIGYAYASQHRKREAYDSTCEVSVYVHEQHRKKKVAKNLYTLLFHVLKKMGYCLALAGITIPNEISESFHQNMGFGAFADYKKVGFKHEKWHDTRWYELALVQFDKSPGPYKSLEEVWNEATTQDFIVRTMGGNLSYT